MNHIEFHEAKDAGAYLSVSLDLCDAVKRWLRENGIPYVVDANPASKKGESVFAVLCLPRQVCREDLEELFDWSDQLDKSIDEPKTVQNAPKKPKSIWGNWIWKIRR